ncbi:hypothetical protein [Ostreibacterium oceani]|uniref:Uncharacterized protein n=1 Tax=Ostreibacterium oceani TaxID=2654998 RepID=A0A6N7F000_9GAMM|nr:hypothetical protein [Ostreibacterium oceani]MPV86098.1 hypothetical protein [Ostreibacterium oceani]
MFSTLFGERQPYQGFNFFGRLKALGVHLIFSLIVFAIFMWVMLVYWFPAPHFQINGGWQGMRIMIAVDLVIGPLLTFFLYNNRKSKKELRFDLGIIIVTQAALIIYGVTTVYNQRPVAQVLSHRGYIATPRTEDLVYKPGIDPIKTISNLNAYKTYPPMLYSAFEDYFNQEANMNDFDKLFDTNQTERLVGDLNPEKIVSRYRPMNSPEALADLPKTAERAMNRIAIEPDMVKLIDAYKAEHGDNFYFFKLFAQYGEAIIITDKKGIPVDYFGIKAID